MAEDGACNDLTVKTVEAIDIGPDFTACLPFGAMLSLTGGKLAYKAPKAPAAAEGIVVTSGGCITDVRAVELPVYTSAPCAPVPNDCATSEGGGDGFDGVVARGVSPITVTGDGTSSSPLTIGYSGSSTNSGVKSVVASNGVSASTSNNVVTVTHNTSKITAGTYNGFTIDANGHVTAYKDSSSSSKVESIVAGTGIAVSMVGTVATIGLATKTCPDIPDGTYSFGGYDVSFDNCEISALSQRINLGFGSDAQLQFGNYVVGLTDTGSISSIVAATGTNAPMFSRTFAWTLADRGASFSGTSDQLNFTIDNPCKLLVRVTYYVTAMTQVNVGINISGSGGTMYSQAPGVMTYVSPFTLTSLNNYIYLRNPSVALNGPVTLEVTTLAA